jgi:predicted nucleotidyltransferase
MIEVPESVRAAVAAQPYPLVFATISGAHLYGFSSADSDYDIRGVHVLSLEHVAGLSRGDETVERMDAGPPELDVVTHDAEKFFRLLLRPNGYVLEQLYSPLILASSPEHEELKTIARGCITKLHAKHYVGFGENQWRLFEKEQPPRVKPLLYVFRVLLTGINLLQTGEIEANLRVLNAEARLPYIDDLVERKASGSEKERLADSDLAFYRFEYQRLMERLVEAAEASTLPDAPSSRSALNDLLLRLRGVR